MVFELFTYGYLNYCYPILSLIELQYFSSNLKQAIKRFSKGYLCLRFFAISPEKDEEIIYPTIHLIEISNLTKCENSSQPPSIQAEKKNIISFPTLIKDGSITDGLQVL